MIVNQTKFKLYRISAWNLYGRAFQNQASDGLNRRFQFEELTVMFQSPMVLWRYFRLHSSYQHGKFSPSNSTLTAAMIGLRSKESNTATCKPQLVIVEGNIGVGKSTLSCQLARKLNYRVFLEPSAKNPYLAKFYKDPKKYALKLQLWIFKQRFRTYIAATKHVLQTGWQLLCSRRHKMCYRNNFT